MRIVVYGAGVIGSVYGARLASAGHEVTLVARGRRLEELARDGIVLEDARTRERTLTWVRLAERLRPEDAWDLVVVAVPRQRVAEVLPHVGAARAPAVLFMVTTAERPGAWIESVGRRRFLAGLPGAAGERAGAVVRYLLLPPALHPTTLGVPGERVTARLREVADAFRAAGFPVAVKARVGDWHRTHAALMTPVAQALYAAGGDLGALARSPALLDLLVRAVRENFEALEMDGVRIRPLRIAPLGAAPAPFVRALVRLALRTPLARRAVPPHALAAREEVAALADELRELASSCWLLAEAGERLGDAAGKTRP